MWGTNLCFSANFPEKEQSEKLAARLARLGFNCVRLHHMDSRDIWGDNPETLTTIDPAQLDRLDYLIYKLKLHGIYVNINLHVSRKLDDRDGFPHAAERPDYDKGLNNFYPPFIELQKKFARDLLTHVNPYTQTAYFEEPAVAMIEISNENSVVEQWAAGRNSKLMTMPEPYITEFQKQWNDFLQRKYGTDEALRAAWQFHNEPLGNEMLPCNIEAANTEAERWYAETDEVSISRKLALANGVFRFEIDRMGREPWRPQLISRPHAFEKGKPYTFSIQARADMPGEVSIGPRKDEDDYGNLGFAGTLPLTTDWQTFTFTFIPKESSQRARFDIGNLAENFTYEFRNSSLKPGGTIGLPESITLADGAIPLINRDGLTVPIDPAGQPLALPNEARDDFCEFLFEIERTYWLGMYRFLKDDLQVRQPVSGTQLYYGSTTIQAQLDYVDVHAYWNHPHFPGRPWDMNDWTVSNRALVNELDREIFPRLATARPFGKPYTVSEFDVPFPNQYAAEALPMLAAFGRFQDWDGIFHFAYSHNRNALESRRITGFFDMVGHTAKLVHLPACVAMFVRGDVGTGESLALGTFNPATELELFQRQLGPWNFNFGGIGLDPRLALFHRTALDVSGNHTVQQQIPGVPAAIRRFGRGFSWFPGNTALGRPDRGVAITTENTKVFTGFNGSRMGLGLSDVTLLVGETRLNWATISMVSMNGNGFDPAKSQGKPIRILVAATGLVENSDMELEHLDAVRITYGNRIGSEPVLCEGIPFELRFLRAESICVYPLDESGNRRERIQVEGNRVELGPEYQTVWYEIEVR
ncbi:MAG: carbohydrate binding domain-containing protein [Planctomycetaceae bacterium]|nr:carbohydrate binding domain-containing protein [Planctomycetaceae bacterium]